MSVPSQRRLECPHCLARLSWSQISLGTPFRCPACHENLYVWRGYAVVLMWISGTIVGVVAYMLGLRGTAWLVATGVGLLPMNMILLATLARMLPPRLRTVNDGILDL